MDIKHTAFPGWPLSGSGGDRPLLAVLSQGGVQVGRRKPVIQERQAKEFLSKSPSAGHGLSREVTNGSFVAAKLIEGHRASAAAPGKFGWPLWVVSNRRRTAASGKRNFNDDFPATNSMRRQSRSDPKRS
jgi:hypothetical protein